MTDAYLKCFYCERDVNNCTCGRCKFWSTKSKEIEKQNIQSIQMQQMQLAFSHLNAALMHFGNAGMKLEVKLSKIDEEKECTENVKTVENPI